MITGINHSPEYKTLNSFSSSPRAKNGYLSYRYHKTRKNETKEAARALIGAITGTAIPLIYFAKKQKTNILKVKYDLPQLIGVSAGSIVGGVAGGMVKADRFDKKQKVNEGIFQFSNAALPPVIVTGLTKITEKIPKLNNIKGKIGAITLGLGGGMYTAAKLANFICDPKDKVPDRKLSFKDSLANIDDALGILALSDIPALKKLPISEILPFIYILCGYRAGESN